MNPNTSFNRRRNGAERGSLSSGHTDALPLRLPALLSWPAPLPEVTISQATTTGGFTVFQEVLSLFRWLCLNTLEASQSMATLNQERENILLNINFSENLFSFRPFNGLCDSSLMPQNNWSDVRIEKADYLFGGYCTCGLLLFFSLLYSTPLWKEDNISSDHTNGTGGFTNTWYTLDWRMQRSSDQEIKLSCFVKW